MNTIVQLFPLECSDREQFILDNQEAFNYGAMEEFGLRDDHFEEEDQIISRDTIEQSIDGGEAYRIVLDGQKVGGIVIKVDGEKGDLDLLFVSPAVHSKGIGYAAWCAVEKLYPEVKVWEIAIFCDSEFFHGKDWEILKPKLEKGNNSEYWVKKISRNIERDKEKDQALLFLGWTIIHFWGMYIYFLQTEML